ncbi:MAG TPA: hypothetical protein VEU08_14705 [Vicinamibacterales bacterium]|nr:hypothetical protein [Vicinamibacterales bacterium]
MIGLLAALGIVLLLGGIAHTIGFLRLYLTAGVPDANRVLLDGWIAQAQLLAGGLFLAAASAARAARPWRALAVFGALTILGFSAAFFPVLVTRAPLYLRLPHVAYGIAAAVVLVQAARAR